jgi:hypothetical protein
VPTDIYFAGQNVRLRVEEDPSQVADAFASARGLPFRLTGHGREGEVYVNPATVAFWSVSESSPSRAPEAEHQPEPESPPQPEPQPLPQEPTARRETVTDIWGQPLRGRPRR